MKVDARGLAFEKDFHVDFHQFICLGPPMVDSKLLKINSSAKGRMRQKLIEAIYRQNPNKIFCRTIVFC